MKVVTDFQRIFELPKGELALLAGRPGIGTESLALTIARGIADRKGSAFIYAPDKLLPSLHTLWLAQESLVSLEGLEQADALTPEDRASIKEAQKRIKKKRIVLSDKAHGGTLKKVLKQAKRCRRLSLLIIACPLTQKGSFVNPTADSIDISAIFETFVPTIPPDV